MSAALVVFCSLLGLFPFWGLLEWCAVGCWGGVLGGVVAFAISVALLQNIGIPQFTGKLQETPDAEEKEYDFTDLFNTVMSPKFRTGALLKQKSNKGNF